MKLNARNVNFIIIFLILGLMVATVGNALAADVVLRWDANSEPNLKGYCVHYKEAVSGPPYTGTGCDQGTSGFELLKNQLSDPLNPQIRLTGLKENTLYYFAVMAYDSESNYSGYSNEVSYTTEGSQANQPPTVQAGGDATMAWPDNTLLLQGNVSDDGLPDTGNLTTHWSVSSGPGTVSFADPAQASTQVSFDSPGIYVLALSATDGELTASDQVTISVLESGEIVAVDSRVTYYNDDAEEMVSNGSMYLDSSDLELSSDDDDNQIIGLRFAGVSIPQGAVITNAYLEFETDETDTVSTSISITAQDSSDAASFGSGARDISGRQTVSASVSWSNIPSWSTVNQKHQTPDLSAVVQAVVDRADWASGNALAFVISGSGCRTAESFDGESGAAPLLHVEYSASAVPTTHTITASAGANGSISPDGTVEVNEGQSKTFTIKANSNANIADVLVDGVSVGARTTYTFEQVSADHTIEARFALDTATITATGTAGGNITPSGAVTVTKGANQSFTIAADSGFEITDVKVDGTSKGGVASYTFANVDQNHTIHAVFAEQKDTQAPTTPADLSATVNAMVVNLNWQASTDNVGVVAYQVYRDGSPIGSATSTSYSDSSVQASKTYRYTVDAQDAAGNSSNQSNAVTVTVEATTGTETTARVASGSDDAEEMASNGDMYTNSTDLELVYDDDDKQLIGVRFADLNIPQGAKITSAYIEFETDETDSGQTDVVITAQDSDDAQTFGNAAYNISGRQTVNASVAWNNIPGWGTVSEKHQTPDLSAVVQAVVDRAGWISGNAMAFIISGSGCRTAESFDGEPDAAPALYVTFSDGGTNANTAPVVDAGEDLTITLPENTVVLNAEVLDDGKPQGSALSSAWSMVSGPAQVAFEDPSKAITSAEFSAAGDYVLKIEATDGELTASDQVKVSVKDTIGTPPNSYEGFGAVTEGAKSSPTGYTTYRVTSLADSGSGSLRDALSQGKRYVVFDVAGTIRLNSTLNVPYSYITIDGASAPSPGITILQPGNSRTSIEAKSSIGAAHDIIIHHLRMDGDATSHSNDGDIWGLDGESAPVYNIILDHITATASPDGCFDVWENVHDVTISWNLITDTITALHLSTGDESKVRQRFSIHHNVFARNNERQIRIRHNNQQIDFVNNVVYGWGWMESGAAGLHIAYDSGETNPSLNAINNVYHYVPGLSGDANRAVVFERGGSEGDVYFSGNLLPSGENDAVSTISGPLDIPASAQVTLYDASTLQDNVVPYVGTHYPTADEQQLLNTIQSEL